MSHWQCATPRSLSSEESERGSRSSGCLVVVVVSLFVLLGRCVALRSTPDGGDFGYFGLDSRPRAPPAGQHGPCAEVREVEGLKFPRLHFGGFAPRAWRVSAGRLKKNRGFSGFSRRGGLAFRFRLLHPDLTTWGLPMNNGKNETANIAFSLIWVY